jgi:hypothetical protein
MRKLVFAMCVTASLFLVSCGGSEASKEASNETGSKPGEAVASAVVNEADWELKNLAGTGKDFDFPNFSVKLPKDAQIIRDTNGLTNFLHVIFKNKYELDIVYFNIMIEPELKLKGCIDTKYKMDIDVMKTDNDIKVLAQDSTGFAYTSQSLSGGKPMGSKQGHFAYFIADNKGGYVSISDMMAIGMSTEEEEAIYSEANTLKIRDIIQRSASFK